MDKITHEVRLAQWKKVIEECHARPEGQTAKSWLSERGISEKCFYYWQRKLRLYAYEEMQQPASLPADKGSAPVAFAEIPFAIQNSGRTDSAGAIPADGCYPVRRYCNCSFKLSQ